VSVYYRPSPGLFFLVLSSFFLFFNPAFPCLAAEPVDPSMQFFVSADKLAPSLAGRVKAGREEVEVMVVLNVDDIRDVAERRRQATGQRGYDAMILEEKTRQYKSRKDLVLSRLQFEDYSVESDYENLPVVHMTVNRNALNRLLQMGEVGFVDENRSFKPHLTESLALMNAPDSQSAGFTGLGTSVAVMDTGVDYTHSAFGSCTSPGLPAGCRVAYVEDFGTDDFTMDSSGHGTNVSGIVLGVAPDADILGLDVFDGASAFTSDIEAAADWVIANRDVYNIVAVNMSFGDDIEYDALCSDTFALSIAIAELKAAGIATAVSSGNETFTGGLTYPACAPAAISVGAVYDADVGGIGYSNCTDATTAADQVTCFSNSADYLKILAPGAPITAAGIIMYGTSQAAPHIAGSVAVLKEADPLFTVDEIVTRLTSTGVEVVDSRNGITTPRVNLYGALFPGDALIGFSPATFVFSVVENGTLPASQTLNIRNDGVSSMAWTVSDDVGWLDILPDNGVDDGSVGLSINTSVLAPGTYNGTLTISSGDALNSPQTVPVSLVVYDDQFTEDFESGDLVSLPWESSGDAAWTVQGGTVHGGSFAAESGAIVDNQESIMAVTINVIEAGRVSFWLKTSTETYIYAGDNLFFKINGSNYNGQWDGWNGEIDWTRFTSPIELTPGIHTISWEYEKDVSVSEGSDKVWIDDIIFPPFNLDIQDISVAPGSYDFGDIAVDSASSTQTFSVSNSGNGDLVIGAVSLTGTDSSQFYVTADSCAGVTLVPTAGCSIDVNLLPIVTGAKSASLAISSNDPGTPVFNAALSGVGLTPFTLSVVKEGTGDGTVSSAPIGIDCGVDCSEAYLDGESVTLSAVADGVSSFEGWSGGVCSGVGDCVVTITGVTEVTATFSQLPPVASFISSVVSGAAPLIVNFMDTSTNGPTSWLWDFDDTETSTSQNPTHVYTFQGDYTVSLIASNVIGFDERIETNYMSVSACSNLPARIGLTDYASLQSAYDIALDNETIEAQFVDYVEDIDFDLNKLVNFDLGYNCEYDAQVPGVIINFIITTPQVVTDVVLDGSLTISSGTLVVESLVIQ
jgi:Subtilase family/PKD domain/Viral BACON domain